MFLYVCKQTLHISRVRITQKVNAVIIWNLQHIIFYVKTKIAVDFQICMRLPLNYCCDILIKVFNWVKLIAISDINQNHKLQKSSNGFPHFTQSHDRGFYSLILFSLYSNDLLKYKNRVIKNMLSERFVYKEKCHLRSVLTRR